MILTPATLPDWERILDEFAQAHPEADFRGLISFPDPAPLGEWLGRASVVWPDESPWRGINPDRTRRAGWKG